MAPQIIYDVRHEALPRSLVSFTFVFIPKYIRSLPNNTHTRARARAHGWMASLCSFLCISGKKNHISGNASYTQEAVRLKRRRDLAWSLQEGPWVAHSHSSVSFAPVRNRPLLNLAETQSLSIFEGLIIYSVVFFCLFSSTLQTWVSISVY